MIRILLALFFSALGWSCSCTVTGSACDWLRTTKVVFVGTVIEDSGEDRWGTRPARMVVDEVFHGLGKEMREVEVDTHAGSSCYMRLRKGERYMIYGRPVAGKAGVVQRNACSFSFAVRGNERLLAALRNAERREGGELIGEVTVKTEQYGIGSEGAAGPSDFRVCRRESITLR